MILKIKLMLIIMFALPGCNTIVVGEGESRKVVSFGITEIHIPERQGDVIALKRKGIGVGFGNAGENSAWLGFDQSEWVLADPRECHLLVVIRSSVEAEHAERILGQFEGKDVCFVDGTSS